MNFLLSEQFLACVACFTGGVLVTFGWARTRIKRAFRAGKIVGALNATGAGVMLFKRSRRHKLPMVPPSAISHLNPASADFYDWKNRNN